MEPIILASTSPRRQEILKMLKIPFRVIIPNIDETLTTAIELEQIPELLAREKVTAVIHAQPAGQEIPWVLGADTLILFENKILGKPQTHEMAVEYLKKLQGNTHTVITSIVLYNGHTHETTTRTCKTKVTFAQMSDKEIEWYAETGEWHGAAGGYRIQGKGSCFIKHIKGTNSAVMGLPIFELYDMLREQNYPFME